MLYRIRIIGGDLRGRKLEVKLERRRELSPHEA